MPCTFYLHHTHTSYLAVHVRHTAESASEWAMNSLSSVGSGALVHAVSFPSSQGELREAAYSLSMCTPVPTEMITQFMLLLRLLMKAENYRIYYRSNNRSHDKLHYNPPS